MLISRIEKAKARQALSNGGQSVRMLFGDGPDRKCLLLRREAKVRDISP